MGKTLSIVFSLLVILPGCISFKSKTTVESLPVGGDPSLPISVEQIASSPHIYKVLTGHNSIESYMMVVKECGISEKTAASATTRQLLVGFENLNLENQEERHIGDKKLLYSFASAELDKKPLKIATFSFKNGKCVRDFVIWGTLTDPKSQFSADNIQLFSEDVNKLTPVLERFLSERQG